MKRRNSKSCPFFFLLFFVQVFACPFTNYEEGLLSPLNPISVETKSLALDNTQNGNSIAFGFWSISIPLWEVKRYPVVQAQFQSEVEENGQLFFLVQSIDSDEPLILGYLAFDSQNSLILHIVDVEIPSSNFQQVSFQYSAATYEGQWVFTLLTFLPELSVMMIEMTDQQPQILVADISGIQDVIFTIGGRGLVILNLSQINMNSFEYNLNIFRGRLSILIAEPQFQFETNNFMTLSNSCQIPQKIIGEQTTFIVQGYQQFNGDALLQYVIDEVGNRYCLSGWVKYDASQTIYKTVFTLVRLSAFKNYKTNINNGDNLFYLQVWLEKKFPNSTQIIVYTNPYNIPLMGPTNYDYGSEYYYFAKLLYEVENQYFYQGLQQWHFVQYEYGRTGVGESKWFLQIQFFNELGLVSSTFGGPNRVASFTNSNFYLFFGGDDETKELLRAFIYNFKFEYNYIDNKQFLFNVCHYSCLACNGPLKNNCISCDLNSFRVFLPEQQICQCQQNYIDYDGDMICVQFTHAYQSIIENEIPTEFDSQCQSGYFYSIDNNNQSQCLKWYILILFSPQQNFNDMLCVDCLYYQLTWFLKPVCTIDLITRKESIDDAYTTVVRQEIDYDLYVISEDNLVLIEGAQDFCDDASLDNCHLTSYLHFGSAVSVICKENSYFSNICKKPDPQCLASDQNGQCLQCLDGMYLNNNACIQCPMQCLKCKYDQQPLCESCYERHTVVNGQCIECGSDCQICKYFQDELLNSSYIRCYKCIDDSKFMLSLDGQNCLPNPIPNCIYAFQGLLSDISINSLDYYYLPQADSDDVIAYCGLCSRTYMWVTLSYECLPGYIVNCDFGYAEYPDFYVEEQVCLVAQDKWEYSVQFSTTCQAYASNCGTCILGKVGLYQQYISCLICSAGYYQEKLSEKCYKCPEDLHCYQCIQQDSFSKDGWKDNIRAFYRQFIEGDYIHPFVMYGQSQSSEDYEIVCSMCQPNYEFLGNKCIPSCPESCLECQQINGENICVKCQSEQNGRRLSLVNNECIQCPQNCALCRERSIKDITNGEINSINPLFVNSDYQIYAYQCLKGFSDQLYYDQEIGQFIECADKVIGCQKQFIIPINLYCSEIEYNNALSLLITQEDMKQFKMQNILVTQLFSGNSFNEVFFPLKISFIIMSFTQWQTKNRLNKLQYGSQIQNRKLVNQMDNPLQHNSLVQMFFPQCKIFNYKSDVQLEILFTYNTIFLYDNTILFQDFKRVTVSGLTIQPKFNNNLKSITFTSAWPLTIILMDIIYQQDADQDRSQIIIQGLKSLEVENLKITNLVQSEISYFFLIKKTDNAKEIIFRNVQIYNCVLSHQIMFLFYLQSSDTVTFLNIDIQSSFNNFTLISTLDQIQKAKLKFQQFNALVQLSDCQPFLDFYRFQSIEVNLFQIKMSKIVNTIVFKLSNLATLSDIKISDVLFTNYSTIITNSDIQMYIKFIFTNLEFENNNYDETSKLISLIKYNSGASEIKITQFYLIGNSAISPILNSELVDSALIYIQFQFIDVSEVEIQRGFGLFDISIVDALKISLNQIKITQHPNFQFLGLHQYLDCQLKQVQGQSFWQSLYIYQTKSISITNLTIIGAQVYNQPLIFIESADLAIVQQQESIEINNIVVKSNILLLAQQTKQTTLFKIVSSQDIRLTINNAEFKNNILHEYVQNQVTDSAALFYVDFTKGFVSLTDSQFYSNFVTNSSNSILYINSNAIVIRKCQFINNSIFQYETLRPYLLWGFPSSQKIYVSNIESIFQVQSMSGNGVLKGVLINITQINIKRSSGSFGGGFKIIAQNQAIISINNCAFSNINSLFIAQDESGGAIYFDGSNAQSFSLNINTLTATNINCRYKGGLLYIQAGRAKANILLENLATNDVYASLGSLLYSEFSNLATFSQKISVTNLNIINTYDGRIDFLNKFTQQESSILVNNSTVIYVNYGDELQFQKIRMENLLRESAFYLSNSIRISIVQFQITNSSLNKNLLNIDANTQYLSYYHISQFQSIDVQIGSKIQISQCTSKSIQYQQIFFQCLPNPQIAPYSLEDIQFNNENCLINNIDNQYDLTNSGLIVFNQLNVFNQLKLNLISLSNIDCENCEKGLISAIFSESENTLPTIIAESITIVDSQCGKSSCLIFSNGDLVHSRILFESQIYQLGYELIIDHYDCLNNTGVNGTCLMVSNLKTLIKNSNFKGNQANISGGAFFVSGIKVFIIESSIISENKAYQGGGFFTEELMLNSTNLKTVIEQNSATFYGDNQVSSPTKMTVIFDKQMLSTASIEKNEQLCIDQVKVKPYNIISDQIEDALYLPTGQELQNYQYFDWKQQQYISFNWQLRLIALNSENIVQKNLSNTECAIQSRLFNISSQSNNSFLNNYTNLQKIYFNDSSQDYNLDNLIVYLNSETASDVVLQLQFSCSSIKIPIYNAEFPFNILDYHNNYYLRLNIRSFACQFGEIKQNDSCVVCDSNQGLFSVELNSIKCSVLEDISTISVKSSQLNIKLGFWRPYLDTSSVSYCLNLPENCQGGWIVGDNSCYLGHIGALCEQCDLYNVRGEGSFSVSTSYSCGTCNDMVKNAFLISAISIWTLFTILISVKSTLRAIEQCVRILNLLVLGIAVSQDTSQSAILIKMLTNFLQILATISTFQLAIPVGIDNTISAAGNPLQTMAYSLDCLLIYMFDFEIHYARMIWQIILPFIYITIFLFAYLIGVKTKFLEYNSSVLTTAFIYIYIYLQPNLVGGLVQLISFRKISGFSWIQANVSYRYDTTLHLQWILEFCLPSLLIIALFIPVFMFKGLYNGRNRLDDKQTRLHWGYLYNEYKKNAYFWEIVKILEKELIIIFITYYQDNIVIKGILIQIIVFFYYQLNKIYAPYSQKNLNQLDAQSAQICMISIALGLGLYISQASEMLEIQIPFFFFLALINLLFFFKIISRILMEYIKEGDNQNQSKLDALRDKVREIFPFLQSIPFFKRILTNRTQQRNRVVKLFKKLKQFLLPQAKKILAFKEYQWETAITQYIEAGQNPILSPKESAERQRFLRNTIRLNSLSSKKKSISSYVLEKMKFNRIDQMAAIFEAGEQKEYEKLPQSRKVHPEVFSSSNISEN